MSVQSLSVEGHLLIDLLLLKSVHVLHMTDVNDLLSKVCQDLGEFCVLVILSWKTVGNIVGEVVVI